LWDDDYKKKEKKKKKKVIEDDHTNIMRSDPSVLNVLLLLTAFMQRCSLLSSRLTALLSHVFDGDVELYVLGCWSDIHIRDKL